MSIAPSGRCKDMSKAKLLQTIKVVFVGSVTEVFSNIISYETTGTSLILGHEDLAITEITISNTLWWTVKSQCLPSSQHAD